MCVCVCVGGGGSCIKGDFHVQCCEMIKQRQQINEKQASPIK